MSEKFAYIKKKYYLCATFSWTPKYQRLRHYFCAWLKKQMHITPLYFSLLQKAMLWEWVRPRRGKTRNGLPLFLFFQYLLYRFRSDMKSLFKPLDAFRWTKNSPRCLRWFLEYNKRSLTYWNDWKLSKMHKIQLQSCFLDDFSCIYQ